MAEQSIVAQWNEVMLEAIRATSKPTPTTYHLYMTSAAIYDAVAAYDPAAYGHFVEIERPAAENTDATLGIAVSFAAYRMLSAFFPEDQGKFDAFMAKLGLDPAVTTTDPSSAAGVGNLAAEKALAFGLTDGSNFRNDFADTSGYDPVNSPDESAANAPGGLEFDPNRYQPLRVPNGTLTDENGIPIYDNDDPSTYVDQAPLTPHWGSVTPFALSSGDQFRPPAPPQLGDHREYVDGLGNVTTGDQAYREQIAEVLEVSGKLTTEQKVKAEFWADGPRTEAPPGHWNQFAQDLALREGHDITKDAKFFFALNAAQFDAGIATWEAKYHYDYIRPQSAIRDLYWGQEMQAWGGPNMGTVPMLGQEWQPYQDVTFVTPPFPEYVSGHSTFSMAAAKTMAAFLGSDTFYDGETVANYDLDSVPGRDLLGEYVTDQLSFEEFPEGEEPVVLRWETLTEAAMESGISRIYGGIHIQDGNLRGQELGEKIAAQGQIRWQALFTRGGDDVIVCEDDGGLVIAGAGNDDVQGAWGIDIVEGGSGNDTIRAHGEDDELKGEGGNDLLLGEVGDDLLLGGTGDDVASGGEGNDAIAGESGADQLIGGAGDDLAIGDAGADGLSGEDGNDVLLGGDDDDTISGGVGNDIVAGDAGDDSLSGGDGDDHVLGADGSDVLIGDAGNDMLKGEAGTDQLTGGTGNDVLLGGAGVDVLVGGAGDDVLAGGDGADMLLGDMGADWFVFVAGETGRDTLFGFESVLDLLVLSGYGDGTSLALKGSVMGTIVEVEGEEVAVLLGIAADEIIEGVNLVFNDIA